MKSIPIRKDYTFLRDMYPGRFSIGIINLGCSRNLVDSQAILGHLQEDGHRIVDVESADVVIVNTCSFIKDAKEESVDVILDLLDLKQQGKIKKLIIAGCLPQQYGQQLLEELEGIDALVGIFQLKKDVIEPQVLLTPSHYAYIKICESCFNKCSFCTIPNIKGAFLSRTIESIVAEVQGLDRQGIKELNIVGQDITAYGIDLYNAKSLTRLLREIVAVSNNIQRIRLLYTFPTHITDELIDLIARETRICNYVDIPLQHVNNKILRRMNRNITKEQICELIEKIRERIPGVSLRTTFIVGFPGESENDFNELLDFIRRVPFERVGVFTFSPEEGTAAHDFQGQIPDNIKKRRRDILMTEQQKISHNIHRKYIGKKLTVIIDENQKDQKNIYIGRSAYDAPEVDGCVYVRSDKVLRPGDFVEVMIIDSHEYDLTGEAA